MLLIGYGYWGRLLHATFGRDITAVCDVRSDILIDQNPDQTVPVYTDLDTALSSGNFQAAIIASPARWHHGQARQCMVSGLDTWIEKPAALDLGQIQDLQDLAASSQRVCFVDHTVCYSPYLSSIKDLDIGPIQWFHSERTAPGMIRQDVDVIQDLAVHDAALLDTLCPDLEMHACRIMGDRQRGTVYIEFTNGITATMLVSWVDPIRTRKVIVCGQNHTVTYEETHGKPRLLIYPTPMLGNIDGRSHLKGRVIRPQCADVSALEQARKHFFQCMTNRQRPVTDLGQAARIHKWMTQ